jgi:hypothetical protein
VIIYIPFANRVRCCWRPVTAAHVSDSLYRILEAKPDDEEWQIATGRIVYCEQQSFCDDFEALVAVGTVP